MAQASLILYNTIGNFIAEPNSIYTSDDILAQFPMANVAVLHSEKARIGINGTNAIEYHRGDQEVIVAGKTWAFVDYAEMQIAKVIEVLP